MAVELAGGCLVSLMTEGIPQAAGTVKIWTQVAKRTGAQAISLRVIEFGVGLSPGLRNDQCDDVLYVVENLVGPPKTNGCTIFVDGTAYEVNPQTGIYLRPGQTLTVDNPGPDAIYFVSSQCPDTSSDQSIVAPLTNTFNDAPVERTDPIVRLADREALPTADRWYRVLVDDEIGSEQVTQFVGSIPPGRAPDHFHNYEEVLFILRGNGRMWAGETSTSIAPGSCIYLPKGQVHCVQNTGDSELRLLGVFYPAGSPAVRYEN
jgi:mannose-6-phosphate isomerase-like protein (cupin superfamily)